MSINRLKLYYSLPNAQKSKEFDLQLSPDKEIHAHAIVFNQKLSETSDYVPLNISYRISESMDEVDKKLLVRIDDIAKLLNSEVKHVRNLADNNKLENEISKRLENEPTLDEFEKLINKNTGLEKDQLLTLLRNINKIKHENGEEQLKGQYNNIMDNDGKLIRKVYFDHFGQTYIFLPLIKGKNPEVFSLAGEYISNFNREMPEIYLKNTKPTRKQIKALRSLMTELTRRQARNLLHFINLYKHSPEMAKGLFKSVLSEHVSSEIEEKTKPTPEQIKALTSKMTGLTEEEAHKLLHFTNMYKLSPGVAYAINKIDIKKIKVTEGGTYLPKSITNLPRSIFFDEETAIILLKGHGIEKLGRGASGSISLAISSDGKLFANKVIRPEWQRELSSEVISSIEEDIFTKIKERGEGEKKYLLLCYAAVTYFSPKSSEGVSRKSIKGEYKTGFFTEYCEKGEITPEKLNKLSKKKRWEFMLNIMKGVRSLHQLGYLHKDLNPKNILIAVTKSGEDEPRIIDFGSAEKIKKPAKEEEAKSKIDPTFRFASPEILITKENVNISEKSDVFSTGAIIWSLMHNCKDQPPWIAEWTVDDNKVGGRKGGYFDFAQCFKRYDKILSKENANQSDLGIEEPESELMRVIFDMVHPIQDQRPNLDDAIERLGKAIERKWPRDDRQ